MPVDDQNRRDPTNSVRLKGFDLKDKNVDAPPAPAVPSPAGAPRVNFRAPAAAQKPAPEAIAPTDIAKNDTAASAPDRQAAPAPRLSLDASKNAPRELQRNNAYTPDPDDARVARRQWWKYELFKRSGRQADLAANRDPGEARLPSS
jgi:hypothetical protein